MSTFYELYACVFASVFYEKWLLLIWIPLITTKFWMFAGHLTEHDSSILFHTSLLLFLSLRLSMSPNMFCFRVCLFRTSYMCWTWGPTSSSLTGFSLGSHRGKGKTTWAGWDTLWKTERRFSSRYYKMQTISMYSLINIFQ